MLADLASALRALRRAPAFVATAVLTLALGIGATTAIFTVVDGMLLRPLPYRDGERLVAVWTDPGDAQGTIPPSYPDFVDWRAAVAGTGQPFADIAYVRSEGLLLRGAESAASVNVAYVSDGFFGVLGGPPLLGRTFRPDEERADGPPVIVLTHRLWQTRFAGDRAIIGRTLDFAEGSYTVVGVMPPGYEYPGRWAEAWAPLAPLAATNVTVRQRLERRDLRVDTRVIARLAPGIDRRVAQQVLAAAAARIPQPPAAPGKPWSAHAVPLREALVGPVREALLVLLGAVSLLLLVACADVANLSLVRASARGRELAVRAALGAGGGRLVRQLLAESVLVGLGGGVVGVALAFAGVAVLKQTAPDSAAGGTAVPRLDALHVDGRVLAFALVVAVGTALLFGLAPAFHARRNAGASPLRGGARTVSAGVGGRRFRDAVTVLQIALTLVLLVGAGLLGRSFVALRAQAAGYPIERLVTLRVSPLATRYQQPAQLLALYDRLRARTAAIPGVRAAAMVNHLPMSGAGVPTDVHVVGGVDSLRAWFRVADGSFFAASGIAVSRGRALRDADAVGASTAAGVAAVVSARFARQAWPGADPLGRRFTVFKQASGRADYGQPIDAHVVGVADDVKFGSLAETQPDAAVYLPMSANPWRWGYLVVRASGDPAALVAAVRRAVRAVDPDIPVAEIRTGAAIVAESMAEQRFDFALVLVFAGCALVLATIGVYGVVAQGVVLRRGELGVRAALGAGPGRLQTQVLRSGARLATVGIVGGAALSLGATRLLEGLLFAVTRFDPFTYVGVGAVLVGVTLLASLVPARRAARTDPVAVLRGDAS